MSDLDDLLTATLNQDWPEMYPSVWAAVLSFKENCTRDELTSAHDELAAVLARGLTEHQLRYDIMRDVYETGYRPAGDGMTVTEFLILLEVELRPGP